MADTKLEMKNLDKLEGGYYGLMGDSALSRALKDCRERPFVDKPRKVVFEIELTPVPNPQDGYNQKLKSVRIDAKVKESYPVRLTNGEHLDVIDSVTADGEPEVAAAFPMTPLFERTN